MKIRLEQLARLRRAKSGVAEMAKACQATSLDLRTHQVITAGSNHALGELLAVIVEILEAQYAEQQRCSYQVGHDPCTGAPPVFARCTLEQGHASSHLLEQNKSQDSQGEH